MQKKAVVFSPVVKSVAKNTKNTNLYSGNDHQARLMKKHQSRNSKQIMSEADKIHAKSGQTVSHPLIYNGLGSLKNIQNQDRNRISKIDEIPQENEQENFIISENDESKIIRQPWVSAQKREMNMASPSGYRSINDSKYIIDYQSQYFGNDQESSLLIDPYSKGTKPPIANKRQQKIQRSASPVFDTAFWSKINSKGAATMLHTRGASPVANLSKHLINDSNISLKMTDPRVITANKKSGANTSRMSVNAINAASNTKSQSKYFQHTNVSVGKVYQVNGPNDANSPNQNYMTQSIAGMSHGVSNYSTHQPGATDMIIQENQTSRKQTQNLPKDIVKRVCQYVIPVNMSKQRQSRNTLQAQQPVLGLKTMGYNTITPGMHIKQKTAGTLQNIHYSQSNFSIDNGAQKNNLGVESKPNQVQSINKVQQGYNNKIPKAILTLEYTKSPNDTGPRAKKVTSSYKQVQKPDQDKKIIATGKYHHFPNKSQASLGSMPSNSSLQRKFTPKIQQVINQKTAAHQGTTKKRTSAVQKPIGVAHENPYSVSIQSDNKKYVNSSDIFHVMPKQGFSRGSDQLGPAQHQTGQDASLGGDYLQTYQDFDLEEGDTQSLEQIPSINLYSTRRPSKNKLGSPTMKTITEKKFQSSNNTTQNTTLRKNQNPSMKMNKSLSPRNVFDRLTNQEKIAEVTGFQNTMIARDSLKKTLQIPAPKENHRGVIYERLRQKYNVSRSPAAKFNNSGKKGSKNRSNGSGNGSPVIDFSKTKFLTFANQIRKSVVGDLSAQMNETKAIQYINDEANQEVLLKQVNVAHFDIWIEKMKDKATLIQFLCHTNKMPNLIDLLLRKKVQVLTQTPEGKVVKTKQSLVDKDLRSLKQGFSCLQLAALGVHYKIMEKLLLSKVNANHQDNKHRTVLWYLVSMYQKESQFKFPNKKIISQINDILELIAPFCEDSLKIEDVDGKTPEKIACNKQLKQLLNEIFQNYMLPSISGNKKEMKTDQEEDLNDSSSMSNTSEFHLGTGQHIKNQEMKERSTKMHNSSWNSQNRRDRSDLPPTTKLTTVNVSQIYGNEPNSLPFIGADPIEKDQDQDKIPAKIKHTQIQLIQPSDFINIDKNPADTLYNPAGKQKNLSQNHIDPSKSETQNTRERVNKHQPVIDGQPFQERNIMQIDRNLDTNIDETQQSLLNNEELNQQIYDAEEQEYYVRQSYQQAPPNVVHQPIEEDYGIISGIPLQSKHDEERGEQSDMGAIQDKNNKYPDETPIKEQIKIQQLQKQMLELDQQISRSDPQTSKMLKVSKTVGGYSRNNFTSEENFGDKLTPTQLDKIQTVETPFKMVDITKNEKFERISSLKYNQKSQQFTETNKKQRRRNLKDKVIGNSFLGSSYVNDSEPKPKEHHIGPGDFRAHQLLGTGSFGEVFLVEEIATKELYAMKVLSKEKINEQFLLKYAFAEKLIMAEMTKINHPYIVKIKYTFQTTESLFMIMQFCSGGDLSQYLELEGCFDELKAKTYICEIMCAIESLHKHNIIFRDLKPDNIVLDSEGHALLTDFGLSRQGISGNMKGADSFCGSYAYLAPEMIRKQGHGKAVDWYLIGVVLFELLTGLPPFYDDNKEILFENILTHELEFPEDTEVTLSSECKDLILTLLHKDPTKRLGNIGGLREIKMHPFFHGVDWNKILQRESSVPPAYLSEMALDIIAKQPFMLKDHPKTQGNACPPGHPMYIADWEMNMTSVGLNIQDENIKVQMESIDLN